MIGGLNLRRLAVVPLCSGNGFGNASREGGRKAAQPQGGRRQRQTKTAPPSIRSDQPPASDSLYGPEGLAVLPFVGPVEVFTQSGECMHGGWR